MVPSDKPSPLKTEPGQQDVVKNGDGEEQRQPIVRVDQIWDKKRLRFRYVKSATPKSRAQAFSRYVIILGRRISDRGLWTGEYVVDIRGKFLHQIISEAYRDVTSISFTSLTGLESEQLKLLFYERATFRHKLQSVEQGEASHLNQVMGFELAALVNFIEEHFSTEISQLSQLPTGCITFPLLWTLFRPNTMVFGLGPLREYRVFRLNGCWYRKNQDGSVYFVLDMDYLDFNGYSTGFVESTHHKTESFDGVKPICQLPFFPIFHREDHADLLKELVRRGERILRLHGCGHLQEYQGHALDGHEDPVRNGLERHARDRHGGQSLKFTAHGRVMLDPVTFDNMKPNNKLLPKIYSPMHPQSLTEKEKALLSPILYGFSFTEKRWGGFDVTHLLDVEWNERIDEMLVLPTQQKDFIRSLVRSQRVTSDPDNFDDIVRNKGRGLVGLLAGPPGVGKTLTAEVVAEITHRPLYMISSGELGESPSHLEKNLASALALAKTWKAVLLLDEADVFLSERDHVNLTRNAITSIFLRDLEYYQGILLLTTNRMSSIDPAFQSRIHFCFEYHDLTEDARLQIWSQFLSQSPGNPVSREGVAELSKLPINGRQIKNAVKIARTVARERNEPLTQDIIQQALFFTESFWVKSPPTHGALSTGSDESAPGTKFGKEISTSDPISASSDETHARSAPAAPVRTLTKPQIGFLSCVVLLIGMITFLLWSLHEIPDVLFKIKLTLMLAAVSAAVTVFPKLFGLVI